MRYVVRWSDAADMGSPSYSLLNSSNGVATVGADPYSAIRSRSTGR